MQEVIAKLNQQKPQVTKPIEKPAVKEIPKSDFDEENEDEADAEFYEDKEEAKEEKILKPEQKVEMEMELLQNNGRFRAELLFQLQELNKALSVIAQVLMRK